MQATAKTKPEAAKSAEDAWKTATNIREIAFAPLDVFSTQLPGSLKSTDAPQQSIDDFNFFVSKMHGISKKAAKPAVPLTT